MHIHATKLPRLSNYIASRHQAQAQETTSHPRHPSTSPHFTTPEHPPPRRNHKPNPLSPPTMPIFPPPLPDPILKPQLTLNSTTQSIFLPEQTDRGILCCKSQKRMSTRMHNKNSLSRAIGHFPIYIPPYNNVLPCLYHPSPLPTIRWHYPFLPIMVIAPTSSTIPMLIAHCSRVRLALLADSHARLALRTSARRRWPPTPVNDSIMRLRPHYQKHAHEMVTPQRFGSCRELEMCNKSSTES